MSLRLFLAGLVAALSSCAAPHGNLTLPDGARPAGRVAVYPLGRVVRHGKGIPVVVPNGSYSFAAKTAVSAEGETVLRDPDDDPSLAADFTAPLAAYFRALPQVEDRISGFFAPEKFPGGERLIRVAQGGKTARPVVLVHGLGSSPHTWKKLSAHLLGSESFRARYELWHYRYPTGAPLATNSARFIDDLKQTLGTRDNAVLIGHSMGGLLALAAATDPHREKQISSLVLLACPAAGNWFATLPQAKLASSFPGVADLSMESEFIRELGARVVPPTTSVHVVLGRHQTFSDGSFTDGIVRSTDAFPNPTSSYVVPTRGHQIHKRDDVIGIVSALLEVGPAGGKGSTAAVREPRLRCLR